MSYSSPHSDDSVPFLWAVLAGYILTRPLTMSITASRYQDSLFSPFIRDAVSFRQSSWFPLSVPWLTNQVTFFVEDLPKLQGALIQQSRSEATGNRHQPGRDAGRSKSNTLTGNPKSAVKLLTSAFNTAIRILIFFFTTFYLLMDGPRIEDRRPFGPARFRPESTSPR